MYKACHWPCMKWTNKGPLFIIRPQNIPEIFTGLLTMVCSSGHTARVCTVFVTGTLPSDFWSDTWPFKPIVWKAPSFTPAFCSLCILFLFIHGLCASWRSQECFWALRDCEHPSCSSSLSSVFFLWEDLGMDRWASCAAPTTLMSQRTKQAAC